MRSWKALRLAGQFWVEDRASYLGAALAFYALFSVAPLAVLVLELCAIAYGEAAAQNRLADYLKEIVGTDAARGLQSLIAHARQPALNWWTSLVALAVLLFTAANLFVQVKTGLYIIWRLPAITREGRVWGFFKPYLIALALVIIVGLFGLVLILASTLLGLCIELWSELWPGTPTLWRAADIGLLFFLVTFLLMLSFRLLSDGRIPWRRLWRGAILSTFLLAIGKILFGWYLYFISDKLDSVYGAASSLIVFLLWVYYSAQIFFLGAEVIRAEMTMDAPQTAQSPQSLS